MRVLQIIDSLVAGGKERQLIELLKGLKAAPGIVSALVVLSDVVQYDEFAGLNVTTHVLPRRSRYDLSVLPRLWRVMRAFRPDVVHSWNAMCSIYAAPLARLSGAKFVDGFIRSAPAGLTMRDPEFLRGRLTRPLATRVLANSMAGLASFGVPAGRGECIHNGFDFGRLGLVVDPDAMRRALGLGPGPVVGMVGSLSDAKDYDSFIALAASVAAVRNDVTFLVVGDGPHRERLEQLAAKSGACVHFLGRRGDVESIVNIFTIGVLLSVNGEGISNAIMEYMAFAKPVIATNCGGNGEIVEEGHTGFLIAVRDVPALTEHVLRLLDDPNRAAILGLRGRERLRERFGLERMTREHVRLYGRILARGGRLDDGRVA